MASSRPTTVAVIVPSDRPPRWVHSTLARIAEVDELQLRSVVIDTDAAVERRSWVKRALLNVYSLLERHAYPLGSSALDPAPLSDAARRLLCEAPPTGAIDWFVDFRFDGDAGRYASLSRNGVLRARSELVSPNDRSWVDAIRRRSPVVTKVEVIDDSGRRLVTQTVGACHPFSLCHTLDAACRRSRAVLMRALAASRGGAVDEPRRGDEGAVSLYASPSAFAVFVFVCWAVLQFCGRLLRHLAMKEEWFIAVRMRQDDLAARDGAVRMPRRPPFERLRAPRTVYLADPWFVTADAGAYLFSEEFDYRKGKGSIIVSQVAADGEVSRLRRVLERPYHLSYPCIFGFADEMYMIPESSSNATLQLYRSIDFPQGWVLDTVLLQDVYAGDATVLEHEGRLWLFVAMAQEAHATKDEELFLFYAGHPRGPWTPHPKNPVVADVRHARPAGAIFEHVGDLIRPGQDCTRGYGHAVSLRCIDLLSVDDYQEHEIGRISAEHLQLGGIDVHTYARAGAFEAVDVRRFRLRL